MKLDEILRQGGLYLGGFGNHTYVAEKAEDGCWRLVKLQVKPYGTGVGGRITTIHSKSYIRQEYEIFKVIPQGTFLKDNKGAGWLSMLMDTGMTLEVGTGKASLTHEELAGCRLEMPSV